MDNRTEVIRYNVKDRGRDFTGADRDIDIPALCLLLNGPVVQESVRKGDICGYVGHCFREKYGLQPPEIVIEGGKTVVLEPTVKTVMIKAYPDGVIEHQQEFLPTPSGRIARALYKGKSWGFSSVFFAPLINGKRTPKDYFGMDFVRSPNYDTNRGYDAMLDSTEAGALQGESFAADYSAMLDSIDSILAERDAQVEASGVALEGMSKDYLHQCRLNDDLVNQNAKLLLHIAELRKGGGAMMDSASFLPPATPDVFQRGSTLSQDRAHGMLDSAAHYMHVPLAPLQSSPQEEADDEQHGLLKRGKDLVQRAIGRL